MPRPWLVLLLAAYLLLVTIPKIYVHGGSPYLLGLSYSDTFMGTCVSRFQNGWFRDPRLLSSFLRGDPVIVLPYRDYFFEYPPLIGGFRVIESTLASLATVGIRGFRRVYAYCRTMVLSEVIVLHLPALLYAYTVLETTRGRRRALLYLALPTTLTLVTSNWDIVMAALYLGGVEALYRGAWFLSGLLLGLGFSAKILAAVLLPATLVFSLRRGGLDAAQRHLAGFVAGSMPWLALYGASPAVFHAMLRWHAGFYCEDCVYLPFIGSPLNASLVHYVYWGILAAIVAATGYAAYRVRSLDKTGLHRLGFLALLAATATSYVFTPQMMVALGALALLVLDGVFLYAYLAADVFNSLILVYWFACRRPLELPCPSQLFAQLRDWLLLALLASLAYRWFVSGGTRWTRS